MKRLLAALAIMPALTMAADIQLTWEAPTAREDGTALATDQIQNYRVYYTLDNIDQTPIEIDGAATSHLIGDVANGNYVFQITTLSDGLESVRSEPVSVSVEPSAAAKIVIDVRIIK